MTLLIEYICIRKSMEEVKEESTLSYDEYVAAARKFVEISEKINDGWKLLEGVRSLNKCYLKKEFFLQNGDALLKAEYVVFFNLSYGVPAFSFNIWNSSGALLTLEDVRKMALLQINEKDFYSVITQQEHPVLFRPYFIMHPCHTETLLALFKGTSKNMIVTFLGMITSLLKLDLPIEYGL